MSSSILNPPTQESILQKRRLDNENIQMNLNLSLQNFAKKRHDGEEISFSENYKSGPVSVFGTVSRKQYGKQ